MVRQAVTLELTGRDPSRLTQFAEYNVYLAGDLIGTVISTALTRHNHRLGRRTVTERSWQARPGRGPVDSRREALQDLLRAWDGDDG